jgi:hypothetical protein
MDEVPDEYLAEILPLAKKIALAAGVPDYNILQVRTPEGLQRVYLHYLYLGRLCRTTGRLLFSMSSTFISMLYLEPKKRGSNSYGILGKSNALMRN